MTGTNLATAVRKRTGTNSTSLTNAVLLVTVNESKNELSRALVKVNDNYFVVPVVANISASSTSDLESREYPWPDDFMRAKSLQIATKVETPLKYYPVVPYSGGWERLVDDIGGVTEANIIAEFSNEEGGAFYVSLRRGFFLLTGTLIAVTNGYRMHCNVYPADLANVTGTTDLDVDPSTTTFGVPRVLHEIWADLCSLKYKTERVNPLPLTTRETFVNQFYSEGKLDELVGRIINEEEARSELFGSLPTYNNGFDY